MAERAMKRYHMSPEARVILRTARVIELKKLAAKTTATFLNAKRGTNLSATEIEQQMLKLVDAYRADYKRPARPTAVAESGHHVPKKNMMPRARPMLLLPTQMHMRKMVMHCLVRRP
jgi:hypothetical protein